jgi:hypothetical protein
MLRLPRGEPIVLLHRRVIRPGQAHIFHAWEPCQLPSRESHPSLIPSSLKVTQLVGDYGHLHGSYAHYLPNQVDRDTRVDVARA